MKYFSDPNDPSVRQLVEEAQQQASDARQGLYQKFRVERTDGSSEPGGKHEHCRYFVLDLDHDKHAASALAAYCESCRHEFPALAADLERLIDELR